MFDAGPCSGGPEFLPDFREFLMEIVGLSSSKRGSEYTVTADSRECALFMSVSHVDCHSSCYIYMASVLISTSFFVVLLGDSSVRCPQQKAGR